MRRLLISLIAIALLLGVAVPAFAGSGSTALYSKSGNENLQSTAVVGAYPPELNSTVTAGNKVIGFTFTDSAAGSCALCDLAAATSYDAANLTGLFGEAYVAAGSVETVIFPLPKKLDNGLVVGMSAVTGVAVIYYE